MNGMRRTSMRLTGLALLLAVASALGSPGASASPGEPAVPAPAVLVPTPVQDSRAPIPTERGLRSALGPLLRTPALGQLSLVIVDPGTQAVLLSRRAGVPRVPASTIKLLTGVAAVHTLGPNTRIATRVVRDGDSLILVGGGDATLVSGRGGKGPVMGGSASLQELARATARAVGDGPVTVGFDASLFTVPRFGPGWPRSFTSAGVIAPVTALMVDHGRITSSSLARTRNPAREAAVVLARLLKANGVRVQRVRPMIAPQDASEVARVESPPVAELVQRMLTDSDNDLAEALAHLTGAAAGTGASFAGGAKAVTAALTELGLMSDARTGGGAGSGSGPTIVDGSGLSQQDRVPAALLANVLVHTARRSDGVYGPIASGLPVAGETGTLSDRFQGGAADIARGNVRAKTGTLSSVVSLAGTVKDADGRVLVFAVIGNRVPSVDGARRAVDEIAVRLAKCGCS